MNVAIEHGYVEIVKLLLNANADVNSAREVNYTPLQLAAAKGREGIVQLLLNAGADIDNDETKGKKYPGENGFESLGGSIKKLRAAAY